MDGTGTRNRRASDADWLQPAEEQAGLQRYLETLRERAPIIIAAVVMATGIAILYVVTASKTYQAEADLLITPVSSSDITTTGLPLIRESSDPTRDVATAARLVTNVDVANRVAKTLNSSSTTNQLLGKVEAAPVADSNILAVTAKAGSPAAARDLANAFAIAAVAEQTKSLHDAIDRTLPALEARGKAGAAGASLRATIASLQTLRSARNPTLSVETKADLPSRPVSPRPLLTIVGGFLAGLVLGIGGAFAWQVLDPRLRREEQLRRLYRLPILARIPRNARAHVGTPLNPMELSPATREGYRTLRGTLVASRHAAGADSRAILVTGSSASEGKTTTAINLASALATAGNRVILIEADLRRPMIGRCLDLRPKYGIASVLIESVALQDALVNTETSSPNLGILLSDYEGGWITELFALPTARELLKEARSMADFVVLDSPPLTDVIDALPLAEYVDDVLVVVGIGKTRLKKLAQLGELLADNAIRPSGFAIVGTPRPSRSDYQYYAGAGTGAPADEQGRLGRRLIRTR